MAEPILIRRLTDPVDPVFTAISRIYLDSIPASSRKPAEWLQVAAQRRDFAVLGAIMNGTAVGFATIYLSIAEPELALLEYLAVEERHRGQGIGAALFGQAVSLAANRAMLLEVDSDHQPAQEQSEQGRRQAFYRRLGCRRIKGLDYLLPLGAHPHPMDLFIANWPQERGLGKLPQWITTVYCDVYGCTADDPRLKRMIAQLQAR